MLEDGTFFGVGALHMLVSARSGRRIEAPIGLFDVAIFRPEVPSLAWYHAWFGEGAPAALVSGSIDETADQIAVEQLLQAIEFAKRVRKLDPLAWTLASWA